MRAIVDASFLARILDSRDQRVASKADELQRFLLERHEMLAPDLLHYEIGNALVKQSLGAPADKRAFGHRALLEGVRLVAPTAAEISETHDLVAANGLTFYDASYLRLASEDGVLFTHDSKLLVVAKRVLGPDRAFDIDAAFEKFLQPDEAA